MYFLKKWSRKNIFAFISRYKSRITGNEIYMKKNIELTENKILELAKHFETDNEISIFKVIEVLFETEIPPKYYEDSEEYSDEIRYDIHNLNRLARWIVTYSQIGEPIHWEISEAQEENKEIDNELANLMITDNWIEKEIEPLITKFLKLLSTIKEKVDKNHP